MKSALRHWLLHFCWPSVGFGSSCCAVVSFTNAPKLRPPARSTLPASELGLLIWLFFPRCVGSRYRDRSSSERDDSAFPASNRSVWRFDCPFHSPFRDPFPTLIASPEPSPYPLLRLLRCRSNHSFLARWDAHASRGGFHRFHKARHLL